MPLMASETRLAGSTLIYTMTFSKIIKAQVISLDKITALRYYFLSKIMTIIISMFGSRTTVLILIIPQSRRVIYFMCVHSFKSVDTFVNEFLKIIEGGWFCRIIDGIFLISSNCLIQLRLCLAYIVEISHNYYNNTL